MSFRLVREPLIGDLRWRPSGAASFAWAHSADLTGAAALVSFSPQHPGERPSKRARHGILSCWKWGIGKRGCFWLQHQPRVQRSGDSRAGEAVLSSPRPQPRARAGAEGFRGGDSACKVTFGNTQRTRNPREGPCSDAAPAGRSWGHPLLLTD